MLQEPPASQYDWNFEFWGYRVRVAWGFWVVAIVLGWGWSTYVNTDLAIRHNMEAPGAPVILLIWIAAIFVSILIHELGHSIAMSRYGINSRIVLYHFGGLAIPDSFGAWDGARQRRVGASEQIIISAAGPVFQLLLAAAVAAAGVALRIRMDLLGLHFGAEEYPRSAVMYALFNGIFYPSVFWAILNLAPILPLDGGQITRSTLMLTNVQRPQHAAHMVSIVAGVLIGILMMQSGQPFAGIMFLMFAASNWQAMQSGYGGF